MSEVPLYEDWRYLGWSVRRGSGAAGASDLPREWHFIDNLLVRIHFIIVMIRWTGLAPWVFEFRF